MQSFPDMLNQIVEKKSRIEQLKAEHPEMAEMAELVEEYMALFHEILRQMQPSAPVYIPPSPAPINPLLPPWIVTCTTM